MAKGWAGDGQYVLPARKVEPYRLWFEFLKLALKDPEIKVDKRLYRSWGDVSKLNFNQWWSSHWRELFSVETGIRVMERDEAIGVSNTAIALRVPLSLDPNTALKEIRELLQEHGIGNRQAPRVKGRFALTEGSVQGFEKNMLRARCMLRLYGYWLKHAKADRIKRIQLASIDYFEWASSWNTQVRTKGWKREQTYLPNSFRIYCAYLSERKAGVRVRGGQRAFKDGEVDEARRQIVRYIRKARKIAENVGRGEFPGKY